MVNYRAVIRLLVEKLCVTITIILVYENAIVFYQYLFPYWWYKGQYQKFFFNIIVGHWLLFNTALHYYWAVVSSPGFVAELKKEPTIEEQLSFTKCSKCGVMRPPRAHHCKSCQKCVLRYDHHCPWINNCVGYRNHVHFFLFCVYMTLISGYATFTANKEFQRILFHGDVLYNLFGPILYAEELTMNIMKHRVVGPITGVLILFLHLANLISMGLVLSLTIWQMSLITKGQTCVEEKIDESLSKNTGQQKQRRPYDLGKKKNWAAFFEVNNTFELLFRLIIPRPFQPAHDGTKWLSKSDE